MPPKRLLVVEDYQQLRDLIGTVLREVGGYSIETAADSKSTERLIAKSRESHSNVVSEARQ